MGACNRLGKDNNAAPFFFFIFEGYLHSTTAINKRQTIPIHLKLVYLGICPPQSRHWAVSLLALSPRTIIEMGRTKFCPFFYLNSISSKQKTRPSRSGNWSDFSFMVLGSFSFSPYPPDIQFVSLSYLASVSRWHNLSFFPNESV